MLDIKRIEIRRYSDEYFFVSVDTEYTKNIIYNKILTKKQIIEFLQSGV
jgi:hypothetical protein